MSYTVRPISDRTAFGSKPVDSQFTVSWSRAEALLLSELRHLKARNVVMELDLQESEIRNDGRPRANARAASPAVRIAFETPEGPMVYATDKFRRPSYRWASGMQPDWQHNVYAIAKGLEALRLIDRYGITERGQQYTGFKAIGGGTAMPASHMTAGDAHALLWEVSGLDRDGGWPLEVRWRRARGRSHPDRHDGERTLWNQVEQAGLVLGLLS